VSGSLAERHEAHQRPGQEYRALWDYVDASEATRPVLGPSKWIVRSGAHSGIRGERRSLPPDVNQCPPRTG
jgi:hypothetical protein